MSTTVESAEQLISYRHLITLPDGVRVLLRPLATRDRDRKPSFQPAPQLKLIFAWFQIKHRRRCWLDCAPTWIYKGFRI